MVQVIFLIHFVTPCRCWEVMLVAFGNKKMAPIPPPNYQRSSPESVKVDV